MKEINRLKKIMQDLRDPKTGCPWDVEQDFKSIAPHTIEEAYEVADAIFKEDMLALKEELGDLLLQVIFHSQMAEEQGEFSLEDVARSINEKLVNRHPHVFGAKEINSAQEQEESWENIKQQERNNKAEISGSQPSILDGIAITLPALTRSVKIQQRAAKVGFDWPDISSVFDKISEEIDETKQAIQDNSNIEEEYGDILFALSNLGRKLKIDPETALRKCNDKFSKRFTYIEQQLAAENKDINDASLAEMDTLWEKAKIFYKVT